MPQQPSPSPTNNSPHQYSPSIRYLKMLRSIEIKNSNQRNSQQQNSDRMRRRSKRFATEEIEPSSYRLAITQWEEEQGRFVPGKKMSAPVVGGRSDRRSQLRENSNVSEMVGSRSIDSQLHVMRLKPLSFNRPSKTLKKSSPIISALKLTLPESSLSPSFHRRQPSLQTPTQPANPPSNRSTHLPHPHLIPRYSSRKSFPKVFFTKFEGASNGNLLESSRLKPTQRHFEKMENVRLAERLLLMEPSKQLRKSQHEKFYSTHKSHKERISIGYQIQKSMLKGKRRKN